MKSHTTYSVVSNKGTPVFLGDHKYVRGGSISDAWKFARRYFEATGEQCVIAEHRLTLVAKVPAFECEIKYEQKEFFDNQE